MRFALGHLHVVLDSGSSRNILSNAQSDVAKNPNLLHGSMHLKEERSLPLIGPGLVDVLLLLVLLLVFLLLFSFLVEQ